MHEKKREQIRGAIEHRGTQTHAGPTDSKGCELRSDTAVSHVIRMAEHKGLLHD